MWKKIITFLLVLTCGWVPLGQIHPLMAQETAVLNVSSGNAQKLAALRKKEATLQGVMAAGAVGLATGGVLVLTGVAVSDKASQGEGNGDTCYDCVEGILLGGALTVSGGVMALVSAGVVVGSAIGLEQTHKQMRLLVVPDPKQPQLGMQVSF